MRRRLLLFLVTIDFVLVCAFAYCWGGGLVQFLGQNLSLKFYNGVLNLYVPGVLGAQEEGIPNIYRDVTASMYPAIAQNEQRLWYESQEENLAYYENQAAEENEQAKQIIAENEKAVTQQPVQQESQNVDETPTQKESKKPEKKTETSGKKVSVNRKKLQDFDYLRQTFYQVDNTTTIGKNQLDVDKLMKPDLRIDQSVDGPQIDSTTMATENELNGKVLLNTNLKLRKSDEPQILIYHTHSQERYADSKDEKTGVVGVGDYLTELLEEEGFQVMHHKGEYDVGDRDHAYSKAAPSIQKIINDNPSIQVVIDLHRDGVGENTRLVTTQNGKKMAKIMFFNGLSRTTASGDIPYLKNPYISDNLAFSFQMQLAAAEYYPDFTRRIYLKGYRFNMHFCPKSMLVEVGAQTNTFEEAKNAMEPLADLFAKVLK